MEKRQIYASIIKYSITLLFFGMKRDRLVAVYGILVGLLMTGLWVMLISTGQVPYLDTPQVEIKLHILTELLTSWSLILGGISILKDWKIKRVLPFVSHGMLLYAIINSSGYYIDLGKMEMAVMFGVLFVCTIAAIRLYSTD